jgi:hypothetical protein
VAWTDQNVGSITGIGLWQDFRIRDVSERLHAIRKMVQDAEISPDAGERHLKKWFDTLSQSSRCTSKIDDLERDFAAFATFDNLKALCYVVRNQEERVQVAM